MRIVLYLMFVFIGTTTAYADESSVGKTAFWKGDFKAAAAATEKPLKPTRHTPICGLT